MVSTGRTSSRVLVVSRILLAALLLVGLVPWRLVAAEAKNKDQSEYYLVKITITKEQPGQAKVVVAAPKIVCLAGQKAQVCMDDESRRLEVTVGPASGKPAQHPVQVQVIRNPQGKDRSVLTAPKITIRSDGQAGTARLTEGPCTIEIEATAKPYK